MYTPGQLLADSIREGAGIDSAMPGSRLEDLLELGLKGTPVSLCASLQTGNDICLEITDKDL